jgi:hypothetical protein
MSEDRRQDLERMMHETAVNSWTFDDMGAEATPEYEQCKQMEEPWYAF